MRDLRADWMGKGAPLFGASKVPEVTAVFWIAKVLTTGMGETLSDFLVHQFDPPLAIAAAGLVFAGVLALQFLVSRYIPWVYWLAVVMVSVFGTMVADILHIGLGVPYLVSTAVFAVLLGLVFGLWHWSERTLSIHSITSFRREAFYWAAVLITFALGTAAGDMTASTLGLGYFASGVLFSVLIAAPAIAFARFGLNAIAAFWIAYILTRPLGASFADWMGVPPARAGLGLGTGPVSLVLAVFIAGLVGYLSIVQGRVGEQSAAS
jgi:uncharacterized membrane-anchored protein